ncbi:DNA repair protein RecO [Paracoccaceae bacterium]|nr:DNA repair protein RecO [Paracoccaceae bacterium]MDC3205026.1 DNA repair protein RecO [Paracoccaceae bacterium]|tara:strand:+ start:118 stop:855 length:738 start_codon:yes stop_codon:yes gene_type:complete
MEWRSVGILLAARKHGETSLIIDTFCPGHGRYLGIVKGGASRKFAPILQVGAQLDLTWKARLQDHLGSFKVELVRARTVHAMSDRILTAGLTSVSTILSRVLPERQPYDNFYRTTEDLLDLLNQPNVWPLAYLHWELELLTVLGYGLDLSKCAVTGSTKNLRYVSPKTGRAISEKAAGEWVPKLLHLPSIILKGSDNSSSITDGLNLTGYFLTNKVFNELLVKSPVYERQRFVKLLTKKASKGIL